MRPTHSAREAGYTLVELLVSMLVLGVMATGVAGITLGSLRADRTLHAKLTNEASARVAMEAVSRTLRTGVQPAGESSPITVAQVDAISFYTLIQHTTGSTANPLPTFVEYYYNSATTCFTEAQTPARQLSVPTGSGSIYAWDTGRSTKCLFKTSVPPSLTNPYFTYYTSGSTTTPITVGSTGLVLADRQTVQSVMFTPTVTDPSTSSVTGSADEVRVTLANVALARGNTA
jgi:prepilin-type N-terminal cleavage/methylation domain-containing protein